jgi:hypothetical protein
MFLLSLKSFRRFAGTAVACSVIALTGCVLGPIHVERETRTLSVEHAASAPVVVRTVNGGVSIVGDASISDVSITAEVKAQTLERLAATKVVAARDADGTLRIEMAWPDGRRLDGEGCDLDIVVPNARDVSIETSNGSVSVTDLAGRAVLRTSNGRIAATRQQGEVDADTSNGAIAIVDPAGAVKADTSNGSIEIENAPDRVYADTSNGRINIILADSSAGPVVADSSNGSIRLTVGSSFRGRLGMSTSNASINVEGIGSRSDAKMSLRKSSGSIQFGEGGEASLLDTSNGSITVTTR